MYTNNTERHHTFTLGQNTARYSQEQTLRVASSPHLVFSWYTMYLQRLDKGVDSLHGSVGITRHMVSHGIGGPILLQIRLQSEELAPRLYKALISSGNTEEAANYPCCIQITQAGLPTSVD